MNKNSNFCPIPGYYCNKEELKRYIKTLPGKKSKRAFL